MLRHRRGDHCFWVTGWPWALRNKVVFLWGLRILCDAHRGRALFFLNPVVRPAQVSASFQDWLTPGWCGMQHIHLPHSHHPGSKDVSSLWTGDGVVSICSWACFWILGLWWTAPQMQSSISAVNGALDKWWPCAWGHIVENERNEEVILCNH